MANEDQLHVPVGNGKFVSYYDGPHVYKVDGDPTIRFNSSSGMSKPFFEPFPEDGAKKYGLKHQMTEQQVLDLWQSRADYGTRVHEFCEFYSLGKRPLPEPTNKEDKKAFSLMKDSLDLLLKDYDCIACEMLVANIDWRLAGLVDAVYRHKITGKIIIVDFKTNKSISTISYPPGKTGLGALSHLPDTAYIKYSLQLGIYKKLLIEQFPDEPAYKDARLYIFHCMKTKVKSIPCHYLEPEVNIMIDAGLERLGLPPVKWDGDDHIKTLDKEPDKPTKIFLVSHVDGDGLVPNILLSAAFGQDNVKAIHCSYGTIDKKVEEAVNNYHAYSGPKELWITDITPHYSEHMMGLLESVEDLTLLDHHVTSKEDWADNLDKLQQLNAKSHTVTIDDTGNRCGTALTYMELRRRGFDVKAYAPLVANINYHDLWRYLDCPCQKDHTNITYCEKCTTSRNIDKFNASMSRTRFINRFIANPSIEFGPLEQKMIDEYNNKLRKMIQGLSPMFVDETPEVKYVQCKGFPNEIAEHLMYDHDTKICLIHNMTYGGLSVRGRFDCGMDVGKFLHGISDGKYAGHALAAGCGVIDDPKEIERVFGLFIDEIRNKED